VAAHGLVTTFFLIFAGAAVLATLALYTRQPLIVAYVLLGALIGPHGAALVTDPDILAEIAEIGIIFLLFLLGLDMQPSKLAQSLRQTLLVGLISSGIFAAAGFAIAQVFGFAMVDSAIVGAATMFSSTIIGIKLLPTTVLHHRHTGEVVVSLLLLQDLIAIVVLIVIAGQSEAAPGARPPVWVTVLALPALVAAAVAAVRWILLPLVRRFDVFHEWLFLLAIGWCLTVSQAAAWSGLSYEIGAFTAGVTLATSPISQYIAGSLRPLRDFFLILFFFTVGAEFDFGLLDEVLVPALVLTLVVLTLKPPVFRLLLYRLREQNLLSWEIGFRLGQISEFSLMVVYIAEEAALIGARAAHVVQATAILTFLVSSYVVVLRYPSPIGITPELRRD